MLTAASDHRRLAAAKAFLLLALLLTASSTPLHVRAAATATAAAAAPACSADGSDAWSCAPAAQHAAYAAAAAAAAGSSDGGSVGHSLARLHATSRLLLQRSTVETACSSSQGANFDDAADPLYVLQMAEALLGDSRLRVTDARLRGSCRALGSATFSSPHAFAAFFPAAVVLSTGDATQAAGDMQDGRAPLSTDLQQPGDASIGAYTHDAAVLEIDLTTSPAVGSHEQLVLSYMFGSEEYGSKSPNPDMLSITISSSSSSGANSRSRQGSRGAEAATDLALLPGGSHIPTPSVLESSKAAASAAQVFSNSGGRYRTALDGFTQVCLVKC